ncbi:Integrator complex subunit 11 [Dinochytrium kinnereticum]|nr:Integrator complex subunit 11 [Dinochytrium kinnereticum]
MSITPIRIVPLGAGQDVGRSCLILTIGGRNIMLDCGMHMGYGDHRRFPDFAYISKTGDFNSNLDCIIISHFHLDHCGALPYFTEICGYSGPIYMTYPTRAIAPILLDDMRKVVVEKRGETNFFNADDIRNCMKKVVPISLQSTIYVDEELEIKPYYAGHVLGAAMFHIRVGNQSVVYTGDYNMTPDRHLGAAWIDECQPDVLITESTYATTIRHSKRAREKDFLLQVHECVSKGGKVLVPVFALGRAQELCILIDNYWDRMTLKCPIYYSAGLTERANDLYRLYINWTNEKIKSSFVERNMFDFKHIKPFERSMADDPGPMVLFASPGMLHSGLSLDIFKKWCGDAKNMIILPGYCVPGTVGAKVLAGEKFIDFEHGVRLEVRLQVRNLSFSAHADSKGIVQLVEMCRPRNVVLVHGEARKMGALKQKIFDETGVPSFDPANGTTLNFQGREAMEAIISRQALKRAWKAAAFLESKGSEPDLVQRLRGPPLPLQVPFQGVVVVNPDEKIATVYDEVEAKQKLGMETRTVRLRLRRPFDPRRALSMAVSQGPSRFGPSMTGKEDPGFAVFKLIATAIEGWARTVGMDNIVRVKMGSTSLSLGPLQATIAESPQFSLLFEWDALDHTLVSKIIEVVNATM